jgi:hypothetical protein
VKFTQLHFVVGQGGQHGAPAFGAQVQREVASLHSKRVYRFIINGLILRRSWLSVIIVLLFSEEEGILWLLDSHLQCPVLIWFPTGEQ